MVSIGTEMENSIQFGDGLPVSSFAMAVFIRRSVSITSIVKEFAVTSVMPESFPVSVVELISTSRGESSGRIIASEMTSSPTGLGKALTIR